MMWKILTPQIEENIYLYVADCSGGTEEMPKGDERNRRATVFWSTYSEGGQNETQKCSYGVGWLQKGIRYSPAKRDYKFS